MRSRLTLFDSIMSLRTMAIAVYDRAKQKSMSDAELSVRLDPLITEINQSIDKAAVNSVASCVDCMHMLQGMSDTHRREAQRHIERCDDLLAYVDHIKDSLKDRMRSENVSILTDGNSIVVLNVVDGVEHVTFR